MTDLRQALAQPEQDTLGSEWVPCVKLPVIVHVRNQREGETHISTREGITPVLPDDLIMRGVAGEEYPIGRDLFERTYTFDVDAVNMSQECVDETAKREHEFEWIEDGFGTMWQKCGKNDCGRFVVRVGKVDCWNGDCPEKKQEPVDWEAVAADQAMTIAMMRTEKREWVGLTDDEIHEVMAKKWWDWEDSFDVEGFSRAIEAKLKEKNKC